MEIKSQATYNASPHMTKIFKHIAKFKNVSNPEEILGDYPPFELGAFEIYFMGVRIFSKIQSRVWPDPR